jgi:integrase/recombinase XerD
MFLQFLDDCGTQQVSEITPSILIDFIESKKTMSSAYRSSILLTLRDFLRCPTIVSQIHPKLINILDVIPTNRYERLPSCYSNDEIKNVLSAINRNTAEGKKDYAIIIIGVDLGLRVSDIVNLKTDNIMWGTDTIELASLSAKREEKPKKMVKKPRETALYRQK